MTMRVMARSRHPLGCHLFLAAVLVAAAAQPVVAQPPHGQGPTGPAPAAPANELLVGFEERFRLETWNNIVDHSDVALDHRSQWRFRTRAWASLRLGDHFAFAVGLNNESKGQGDPQLALTLDETVFETLWVDIKPNRRVSIRAGRQDLQKGDGLILFEGTPLDGSRTLYVNGLDASFAVRAKATLELIALSNPSEDTYLPVAHDRNRPLIEWNERLAGAYYTDTSARGLDLQAYYFFKREFDDSRPQTDPQFRPERQFHTVGARVAGQFAPAWTVSAEFAGQRGEQGPATPIRAWAGSVMASRRLGVGWAPTIRGGVTALSGDSPETTAIEGWDPVLSRWPKWSEAVINALGPEVGASYWTNIALWQAELTLKPSQRTGFRATYYHLSAFHPFPGSPAVFGPGTNRGDLLEARLDFSLHDFLKGHVLYERLIPGSFYTGRTPGYFFRVECTASFRHGWTWE
jgi:hypothetical protein